MFQSIHFFLDNCLLFFPHRIWSYRERGFIFQLKVDLYEWTCAYLISKTENIMEVVWFSFLPLSSSNESSKFNLCLNILASVMCLHLSSGSSHGYLSSLVGTLLSSVSVSVHVNILGISDGSIGLLYAKDLGLKVAGVSLSCKY